MPRPVLAAESLEQLARIEALRVVLFELLMPRMNGWEFATTTRRHAVIGNRRR